MKEIKFFILTLKVENCYQAFSWIGLLVNISFKTISVPFYFSKLNYSLFTNFVKAFNFFFIQEIVQLRYVLCVSEKSTFSDIWPATNARIWQNLWTWARLRWKSGSRIVDTKRGDFFTPARWILSSSLILIWHQLLRQSSSRFIKLFRWVR